MEVETREKGLEDGRREGGAGEDDAFRSPLGCGHSRKCGSETHANSYNFIPHISTGVASRRIVGALFNYRRGTPLVCVPRISSDISIGDIAPWILRSYRTSSRWDQSFTFPANCLTFEWHG